MVEPRAESCSAWAKAPADVSTILSSMGAQIVRCAVFDPHSKFNSKVQKLLWFLRCFWGFGMKRGSALLMQHPQGIIGGGNHGKFMLRMFYRMLVRRRIRLIVLIHDLYMVREFLTGECQIDEMDLFERADIVIVHNAKMRAELLSRGIPDAKMIELEIFDYLTSHQPSDSHDFRRVVTLAGNLRPDKAGYLTGLGSIRNVSWKLYGKKFDDNCLTGAHIDYCGCFSADDVVRELTDGLGLVWDGSSIEGCQGGAGSYLKFNNPHKLSMYLAAGLPVAIWREAAEADFVLEHGVGIVVASLTELAEIINDMPKTEYFKLKENAINLSRCLREGYYTKCALEKALVRLYGV